MNKILTALAVASLSGSLLFGAASYDQLVDQRKQAIKDWGTVLAALKKQGFSPKDPAYKRTLNAQKRSEGRLSHLEKMGPTGYKRMGEGLAATGYALRNRLGTPASKTTRGPVTRASSRKSRLSRKRDAHEAGLKGSPVSKKRKQASPKRKVVAKNT